MLGSFKFSVSALATHATADLSSFASNLGKTPDHIRIAGEPIVTPNGHAPGGTYFDSRCLVTLGSHQDGTMRECFERAADLFEGHPQAARRVIEIGGSVELFARWYPNGDTGELLPSALLSRIGALGVSVGFNVYGVQPETPED
jgi:hypothetical protein